MRKSVLSKVFRIFSKSGNRPLRDVRPIPTVGNDSQVQDLIQSAQSACQLGNFGNAEELLLQALAIQPQSVDANFALGKIELATKRYASAAKHVTQALLQRSDESVFHDTMGAIRYAEGQLPEAKKHYCKALQLAPTNAMIMFNLALTLVFQWDFEEAGLLFEQALSADPSLVQNLRFLGKETLATEQPEVAEVLLRSALLVRPSDLLTLDDLYHALINQEKVAQALVVMREMVRAKLAVQQTMMPISSIDPVHIADTTLCCVDTCNHDLAIHALKSCMAQCTFSRVLFFTNRDIELGGVDVIRVDEVRSFPDYSRFMIKELNAHIDTEYALIIQYDGFILDATKWDEDFKQYDYIGARWSESDEASVGNGGFSLRSKRLLVALQDSRITQFDPEDSYICGRYRALLESEYDIRFAPGVVADAFSFEGIPRRSSTFGFHGLNHLVSLTGLDRESAANYTGGVIRKLEYQR